MKYIVGKIEKPLLGIFLLLIVMSCSKEEDLTINMVGIYSGIWSVDGSDPFEGLVEVSRVNNRQVGITCGAMNQFTATCNDLKSMNVDDNEGWKSVDEGTALTSISGKGELVTHNGKETLTLELLLDNTSWVYAGYKD